MRRSVFALCLAAVVLAAWSDRPARGEEARARLFGRIKKVNLEANLFTVTILQGQIRGAGEDARGRGDEITFGINDDTEIRGVAGLKGLTPGRRAWITYEPRQIPGAQHMATLVDVLSIREGDEEKEE